jgi:hypothetical protein
MKNTGVKIDGALEERCGGFCDRWLSFLGISRIPSID